MATNIGFVNPPHRKGDIMKSSCLVLIAMLLPLFPGYAQSPTNSIGRHKIGFITGYGGQHGIDVDYTYEVVFMQLQYAYRLWEKKNWSLEVVAQPQYNITRYRFNQHAPSAYGYELGINVGVMIKVDIIKGRLGIYLLPSIGPHYISNAPERQTDGFIFSDNLFMGIQIQITDGIYLDIRPGFRHISNGGIYRPNGGLNTTVWSGGVFFALK